MPTFERLDYGSSDGSQWGGASTDFLAFWGNTPLARLSITSQASTISASTDLFGLVTTMASCFIAYGLFGRI